MKIMRKWIIRKSISSNMIIREICQIRWEGHQNWDLSKSADIRSLLVNVRILFYFWAYHQVLLLYLNGSIVAIFMFFFPDTFKFLNHFASASLLSYLFFHPFDADLIVFMSELVSEDSQNRFNIPIFIFIFLVMCSTLNCGPTFDEVRHIFEESNFPELENYLLFLESASEFDFEGIQKCHVQKIFFL